MIFYPKANTIRYKVFKVVLGTLGHFKYSKYPFWLQYDPTSFNIKGEHTTIIMEAMQPGDILLRGYNNYLSELLIPGKWSHAALVTDNHGVVHAVGSGIEYQNIIDFCRCDRIILIRPKVDIEDSENAVNKAKLEIGKPYDHSFIFEREWSEDQLFSCSELIYHCYRDTKVNFKMGATNVGIWKVDKFTPDDILNGNIELIKLLE